MHDYEIEEIFINYYSKDEFINYKNWKRSGEDGENKFTRMTKDEFENADIMADKEELSFYKNLFKSLKGNINDVIEKEEIMIKPLFDSYLVEEEEVENTTPVKKKKSILFRKSSKLNEKFDLRNVNDEIIKKFGN